MEKKVRELKSAYNKMEKLQDEINKSYSDFKDDPLYIAYTEKRSQIDKANEKNVKVINDLTTSVNELKKDIKSLAIKDFEKNNKKKLFGGIGIRETKTVEYDDKKALTWAKEKDMFLILDKKNFDKTATTLDLDFVTKKTVAGVTFPKVIKIEETK